MKPNHTRATVIALIAAAGLVPTFAPAVQAQAPQAHAPAPSSTFGFQRAQEALEHQIIARQVQLALLGTEVADAANVTTSDRSALVTVITNEQGALATDATNAAAATTYAELDAVRKAVIGDERVYAVVTGQVNLVLAADNDTVTESGYTSLAAELGPLVTELGSSHASALLADVTSEVTAAAQLTTGVSAEALALTPAGYPGNQSEIKAWAYALSRAQHDIAVARSDIKQIEAIALNVHRLHFLTPVASTTTTTVPPTTTTSSTTTTTSTTTTSTTA
jgi:hypothetical protein